MNSITIIGEVDKEPIYYCTVKGQDLLRIQINTPDRKGNIHTHHCVAYGPAAIDLHVHLTSGNQLMVRGELLYRKAGRHSTDQHLPYILIRQYTYLDNSVKEISKHPAGSSACVVS